MIDGKSFVLKPIAYISDLIIYYVNYRFAVSRPRGLIRLLPLWREYACELWLSFSADPTAYTELLIPI